MRLTKKRKEFLKTVCGCSHFLQAIDMDYDQNDEKNFKKEHGISFKEAEQSVDALVNFLSK